MNKYCIYTHIHIHIYTYTHIYTYIHIYTYTHTYIYIYTIHILYKWEAVKFGIINFYESDQVSMQVSIKHLHISFIAFALEISRRSMLSVFCR